MRILPVLRLERAAGRLPPIIARVLAAWLLHLRGAGGAVDDPDAAALITLATRPLPDAIPGVLNHLAPELADDADLVAAVSFCVEDMAASG